MAALLVAYFSKSGNTKKMAHSIGDGLKEKGHEVTIKEASKVRAEDLKNADGIIAGSPTYYGGMGAELKEMFDRSVILHGRLDGKAGAAFTSAANTGGGNETTIMNILGAFLIHGMIIQGDPKGSHYGPVAIGAPDKRATRECARLAERFDALMKRLGTSSPPGDTQ